MVLYHTRAPKKRPGQEKSKFIYNSWPPDSRPKAGGPPISNIFLRPAQYIRVVFDKNARIIEVEVSVMISYAPFYKTLKEKNITEYYLIFKAGISANTIHRMKHGYTITLKTLDTLCSILQCPVSDIIEYIPDE